MRKRTFGTAAIALAGLSFTVGAPGALGTGGQSEPARASAYVVADTNLPTFNPDVRVPSNCAEPDRFDIQDTSPSGMTVNNVHIDACLFSRGASRSATTSDFDGPATYQAIGVGAISACPDPDGDGPKTAALSDTDNDGQADRCTQTGYQDKSAPGDGQFHARFNSTVGGPQLVWFCSDSNQNGCFDERVKRLVVLLWSPGSFR